jgi:hypothetical protein
MEPGPAKRATLKEKAREEFREFWVIALYLAIFLGALMTYRRLVLAEVGVTYLHYGFAMVEALILAKVILVGEALGLGRRFERPPLLVAALVKAVLFGLLVGVFTALERVIEGFVHGRGWPAILASFVENGLDEMAARTLMMIAAFVPFFAFWEMRRVLGPEQFYRLFFASSPAADERPAR